MLTRVVKLSGLADGQSSGSDDHDSLDVGPVNLGQDLARDPPGELGRRVERVLVRAGIAAVAPDSGSSDRLERVRRSGVRSDGRG